MTEPPTPPRRWREDAGLRPPGAEVVLRGARPRAPSTSELARLSAAVGHIGRSPQSGWRPGWKLALATAGAAAIVAGGTFALRAERQHQPPPAHVSPLPMPAARVDQEVAIATPPEETGPPPAAVTAPAPQEQPPLPPPSRPASVRAHARSHAKHAVPAVGVSADQLQRETRMIDAARAALASSPARALAVLEDHRREFPSGQLAAEREFLAVEALRRTGHGDEARRRAQALMARFPSSPYASRARRALASTPPRATEPDRGGPADMP
jgi:hypothetical protein